MAFDQNFLGGLSFDRAWLCGGGKYLVGPHLPYWKVSPELSCTNYISKKNNIVCTYVVCTYVWIELFDPFPMRWGADFRSDTLHMNKLASTNTRATSTSTATRPSTVPTHPVSIRVGFGMGCPIIDRPMSQWPLPGLTHTILLPPATPGLNASIYIIRKSVRAFMCDTNINQVCARV